MKKNREVYFLSFYFLCLVVILGHFCILGFKTLKFNKEHRSLTAFELTEQCSFDLFFRGGAADSWLKRDVQVYDQICTLKGSTYDGVFKNGSDYQISQWNLQINIQESCFLNNCWCGTVEIHQKNKVQTLDLRNVDKKNVVLDYVEVGQDFMIPLQKGDFIIYNPSEEATEMPLRGYSKGPGTVTVGFIFYTLANQNFDCTNYTVNFNFKKHIYQGKQAKILLILLGVWFFIFLIKLTVWLSYKKAKAEAEHRLNAQRLEDMKTYNAKLNAQVEAKTAHIKEIQQKVVQGLANVIGNRDPDTGGHVDRTSDIIKIILEEFRSQNKGIIDDAKASQIARAAPMHDLGKIYIESAILCKPAKLTDEEFAKMKKHSENSGDIVKLILKDVEEPEFVHTAFNVARFHHERWDGKGYPDGLAGNDIPLEARIMAIADVYDALVSPRCYKKPMSFEVAYDIMIQGMGSQFDPQMQRVLQGCRSKLEEYYLEVRVVE